MAHTARTAARRLLFGCACALVVAGPAPTYPRELTVEETRTVTLDGETAVYVKNARGQTIILGRRDGDAVLIRANKYVRARSAEQAEKWMDELTFKVESDGEKISIITQQPDRLENESGFWALLRRLKHRARIDYTIEVPSALHAEVSSASGDVQIVSLDGNARVFGSSGDIFLRNLGGEAFVELSSGDVEVTDVAGDVGIRASSGDAVVRKARGSVTLQATSGDLRVYEVGGNAEIELASGDILLEGCAGNVTAMAASGDVIVRDAAGGVRAVAASGDVHVDIVPVGGKEFILKTSSGDVSVRFATPERYGFKLDVTTSSGTIEGDLDIKLDKISRRVLRGTVGTGESRVVVETASGNIRIVQAK